MVRVLFGPDKVPILDSDHALKLATCIGCGGRLTRDSEPSPISVNAKVDNSKREVRRDLEQETILLSDMFHISSPDCLQKALIRYVQRVQESGIDACSIVCGDSSIVEKFKAGTIWVDYGIFFETSDERRLIVNPKTGELLDRDHMPPNPKTNGIVVLRWP